MLVDLTAVTAFVSAHPLLSTAQNYPERCITARSYAY